MNLEGKKVLVVGAGVSGISAVKALSKLKADIAISDSKNESELIDEIEILKNYKAELFFGGKNINLDDIDLILKSPGVPPNIAVLENAKRRNIEILTDIELAFRISNSRFICITGTNGKTTSTVLSGQLFKLAFNKVHIVGNVGVGILSKIDELLDEESIFIIEASSFQLENTEYFKPKVALITNVTPDHLDWHGNFENYYKAKFKIFSNQDKDDYTILNYDDELLRKIGRENKKSNTIFFSRKTALSEGIYVKDDEIISTIGGSHSVMSISDIRLPGKHNLENIMGVIAIAEAMKIDSDTISKAIKDFNGVEHRLEYVDEFNGVKFYNDSKGTNVDSTVTAIRGLEGPINLIAGGKDKGGEFHDLIDSFDGKIDNLILIGETASKIEKTAEEKDFHNIYRVNNMKEAVKIAYDLSKSGHTVLLSPACASWDMYKSYEIRGKDFKDNVISLKGETKCQQRNQ